MPAVIYNYTNAQLPSEVDWNVGPLAMLHMDFVRQGRLRQPMDDDTAELTTRLCSRIGMIMEDASVLALTIGTASEAGRLEVLAQLDEAAVRISDLVRAARAIQR
jgi:hypothetical protein